MKHYTPNLGGRDVVMISDAVVDEYDKEDQDEEKLFLETIKTQLAEHKINFFVEEVNSIDELKKRLLNYHKDRIVIFNWCEEITGQPNTGHLVTKFLESEGYTFSGATTKSFMVTNDRSSMKKLLLDSGIPTPKFWDIKSMEDSKLVDTFPVLLKSRQDHGSFELTKKSVIENPRQLVDRLEYLFKKTNRHFIAEQFIVGDEYILSIWGNETPQVLPIYKVAFDSQKNDKYKLQSYESKWNKSDPDFKGVYITEPENLTDELNQRLIHMAYKAYVTLGIRGFARLEVRVTTLGEPYIIDFNVNPNFRPGTSFLLATQKVGFNYGETVARLCELALEINSRQNRN